MRKRVGGAFRVHGRDGARKAKQGVMVVKSKYTFEKRQKENMRRQKKEEKAARRQEAKQLKTAAHPENNTMEPDPLAAPAHAAGQEDPAEPGDDQAP